jgi:dihydrodipicolinate synthase/N-acetylneuraminate lyase
MCLQLDVFLVARPDMDVVGYYKSIAKIMPVMLMGWPAFSLVDQLLDEPRICAFKEDGSMDYGVDACRRYGQRLKMMSGGGLGRHYAYWPYGCRAFMSIWPALKPEMDQRYWNAVQSGDHETATELIKRNWTMFDASSRYPGGWQAFWRGWFELKGVAKRYLRPPLRSLTDAEMERLKGDLQKLGAL